MGNEMNDTHAQRTMQSALAGSPMSVSGSGIKGSVSTRAFAHGDQAA